MTTFEYDQAKSMSNMDKHGIDFNEAAALWSDPGIMIPAATVDETRFLAVGRIDGKCWTAVATLVVKTF